MENTGYADLIRQHLVLYLVGVDQKAPKLDLTSVVNPFPSTGVLQKSVRCSDQSLNNARSDTLTLVA
jgi:hypothetical protein